MGNRCQGFPVHLARKSNCPIIGRLDSMHDRRDDVIMTRNLGVASCLWVALCTRVPTETWGWEGREAGQFKSIRTVFTTACGRANVPGASRHGLRSRVASSLLMAGMDIRTIQGLAGGALSSSRLSRKPMRSRSWFRSLREIALRYSRSKKQSA